MTKVLVIGIDGGTWDIIHKLFEENAMPNLFKLCKGGCYGDLESTLPPVTIPAWPAFFTGKNPGKFGVVDFMKRRNNTYEGTPTTSRDICSLKLWDILFKFHKRYIIVNLPGTYPPKKCLRGVIISSNLLTPRVAQDYYWPKEIEGLIKKVNYHPFIDSKILSEGSDEEVLKYLAECISSRGELFRHLIKEYEWDFAFVLFTETDTGSHKFLKELDKIKKIYSLVDKEICKIIANTPKDTYIIVMSDHGHAPIERIFYINDWLKKKGYAKLKRDNSLSKLLNQDKLLKIIQSLGLYNQIVKLPFFRKLKKIATHQLTHEYDFSHTKVYLSSFNNDACILRINLSGREPNGIVSPDDYLQILENIKKELLQLTDEKGQPVIEQVYLRDEVYTGKFLKDMPDIVVVPKKDVAISRRTPGRIISSNPHPSGHHSPTGIFVLAGPGVRHNKIDARIYDILPTILYLLELPTPNGIDGKPLIHCLAGIKPHKRTVSSPTRPS